MQVIVHCYDWATKTGDSGLARGLLSGMIVGAAASVVTAAGVAVVVGPPDMTAQTPAALSAPQTTEAMTAAPQTPPVEPTAGVTAPAPDPAVTPNADPAAQPVVAADSTQIAQPSAQSGVDMASAGSEQPVTPPPATVLTAPTAAPELSISTDPSQPPVPSQPIDEAAFSKAETQEVAAPAQPEPITEKVAEPQPEQPAPEPQEVAVAAVPEASVLKPVGNLIERNRASQTETPEAAQSNPPIKAFAAPFENPDNKPVMSIVLIDRGDSPIGLAALSAFPYPLSFAVDTSRPDAAEAMARYRAAGLEVLALTDLPEGAGPSDVEVALQTILSSLPEVVGVMDGDKSGIQSSKSMSDQVTAILAASGHGVLFFPKGLDTAQKLAAKEGVPSATVFSDFDSKGQNAASIRRFLDAAAIRAARDEGGVVAVGRLRPDTISALLLWGLQDKASRVALAPISAVLNPTK